MSKPYGMILSREKEPLAVSPQGYSGNGVAFRI